MFELVSTRYVCSGFIGGNKTREGVLAMVDVALKQIQN
jgi:uncharacterized UPF0160 family protein